MSHQDWYLKYGEILKAIGHPVRLRILEGLLRHECSVGKIVEGLGLPQSTVSQHLGILRNKGLIVPRKEGVTICYRVVDEKVTALVQLLQE